MVAICFTPRQRCITLLVTIGATASHAALYSGLKRLLSSSGLNWEESLCPQGMVGGEGGGRAPKQPAKMQPDGAGDKPHILEPNTSTGHMLPPTQAGRRATYEEALSCKKARQQGKPAACEPCLHPQLSPQAHCLSSVADPCWWYRLHQEVHQHAPQTCSQKQASHTA